MFHFFKICLGLTLFFFSISDPVLADGYEYQSFKINKNYQMVVFVPDKFLTVTKGCGQDVTKYSNCLAMQALKKVSYKDLATNALAGGKNPGSVLCSQSAKGEVVFAKDKNRRYVTFCQFSDSTIVSSDSLNYYASVNDSKKQGAKK